MVSGFIAYRRSRTAEQEGVFRADFFDVKYFCHFFYFSILAIFGFQAGCIRNKLLILLS